MKILLPCLVLGLLASEASAGPRVLAPSQMDLVTAAGAPAAVSGLAIARPEGIKLAVGPDGTIKAIVQPKGIKLVVGPDGTVAGLPDVCKPGDVKVVRRVVRSKPGHHTTKAVAKAHRIGPGTTKAVAKAYHTGSGSTAVSTASAVSWVR